MATLEDSIGCWTVHDDGLAEPLRGLRVTAQRCRALTVQDVHPALLLREIELFRRQANSLLELADSAHARCAELVALKRTD